jgi:hypothetical protein
MTLSASIGIDMIDCGIWLKFMDGLNPDEIYMAPSRFYSKAIIEVNIQYVYTYSLYLIRLLMNLRRWLCDCKPLIYLI